MVTNGNPLEHAFPDLVRGGYAITSPADKRYNCIAYAAGDTGNWWWPLPADVPEVFWPTGVTRTETVAAFRDAFAALGVTVHPSPPLRGRGDGGEGRRRSKSSNPSPPSPCMFISLEP